MTERITDQQFHDAPGVDGWVSSSGGVRITYETGDFATGVSLINQIGALADAADHHPDVDLRYGSVGVYLITHDVDALTEKDVDLASKINVAADDLGVSPAPPT